ncbi:MAG: sodium-independent anion transporter, partial [Saprospiraceae bacterium]|nr:sodium-independent anion transporter [Saprospiraceae bacterium]
VYIKHLDGPLFFGFASRFQDMMKALPMVQVVIFRMEKVPYIDQSGLYAMEEAILELHNRGIRVAFSHLDEQPLDMLRRIRIIPNLVPESMCFGHFNECARWLENYLEEKKD